MTFIDFLVTNTRTFRVKMYKNNQLIKTRDNSLRMFLIMYINTSTIGPCGQ